MLTWRAPPPSEIVGCALPHLGLGDRLLLRALVLLASRHVVAIHGLQHIRPATDPFILALAAALMRAATEEMVARGHTHVVTDVFEDDPHSPLGFHTRVMGFMPVATHDHGELHCTSRRITLVLDLKSSYLRLKARGNWVYRYLTAHWPDALHRRLAA